MTSIFYQLHILWIGVVRNFKKNRFYNGLNLLGSTIGFASMMLILGYIYHETTFESFHQHAERIYRPTYRYQAPGGFEVQFARVPVDYINELPNDLPEVERLVRFQNQERKSVRIQEERFRPNHAYVTDQHVFEVFDLPLLHGEATTALSEPSSVVLDETTALTYFGTTDIIGESIHIIGNWSEDEKEYRVTGVMKDLDQNTHLPISMLMSFSNEEERSGWAYIYLLLNEGASIADVEEKMPDFIQKYNSDEAANGVSFEFQALGDIHLTSDLAREIIPNGRMIYVKIFLWAGLLIWLIAMVNFSNLSSALFIDRSKEIGVRKVLGASRSTITLTTIGETILFSIIALTLGSAMASVIYPSFAQAAGINGMPPLFLIGIVMSGIAVLSGALAGTVPAIMFYSMRDVDLLKNDSHRMLKGRQSRLHIRHVMLTIQFVATIVLVSSAAIAYKQFTYLENKNLGLSKNQTLAISQVPDVVTSKYTLFKNRIHQLDGIKAVSACMQVPSSAIRDIGPVLVQGLNNDEDQAPRMDLQIVDPAFIDFMGISLIAGENFSESFGMDAVPVFNEEYGVQEYLLTKPRKYLINETGAQALGWNNPQDAIGQMVNWSIGNFELAYGPIVGVVEDFHQESLRNKIDPTLMTVEPIWLRSFLVDIESDKMSQAISGIESVWNDMFPYAFEYSFIDGMYNELYIQDKRQIDLLSTFSLLACVIALIGLISLMAYALKTRSKELAIRRILGARIGSMTTLMGKEYFIALAIAAGAAIPLGMYWTDLWLRQFAYRISISPLVYILTVSFVFAAVLLIIYIQTLRSTSENPLPALNEY